MQDTKRHTCRECIYWKRKSDKYGDCTHPKAASGYFLNHTRWCKEGYRARHTTHRYKGQQACKTRFINKNVGRIWERMKTVYICSPYRATSEAQLDNNIDYAQELTRTALNAGLAPITPHLYLTQVTDDSRPAERERGLAAGTALLLTCDFCVMGNRYGISAGMQGELDAAAGADIPVIVIDGEDDLGVILHAVERYTHGEK